MFSLADLRTPIVAAPMAGGPSTPALVAAVADAGGFGFLAGGGLTPDGLAGQLAATRAVSQRPFGVNLFAPPDAAGDADELDAFRERLRREADRFGVALPPVEPPDDDHWQAKLVLLERDPVAVVSVTFGLPTPDALARLHAVGTAVWASVASVPDAVAAIVRGVDALVVQGVEAGGHRATLRARDEPHEVGVLELVRGVRALTGHPLVAAGGIASADAVAAALDAGADAVAVGTAFLRTPEAGTSPAHRAALADPAFSDTVVTRAFTGRPARTLTNTWAVTFADAPAAYPQVHRLTLPIRAAAAAAGDTQRVHLWAGTGWREASDRPAGEAMRALLP